jgi:hypothetical protein
MVDPKTETVNILACQMRQRLTIVPETGAAGCRPAHVAESPEGKEVLAFFALTNACQCAVHLIISQVLTHLWVHPVPHA